MNTKCTALYTMNYFGYFCKQNIQQDTHKHAYTPVTYTSMSPAILDTFTDVIDMSKHAPWWRYVFKQKHERLITYKFIAI